ncbi:hypothetical protein MMC17_003038 [Xylographa soralifera]|nr:hypothetical protein [Xylographa soralifera]
MSAPQDSGGNKISDEALKAMNVMSTAAMTLWDAISRSLPVASSQLLTVQIPGTVINHRDYYYDQSTSASVPLQVLANEARLVDGMLPLSKITMGKTGKSVARSYISALDLLIPVEASVSGLIASPSNTSQDLELEGRRKIIKDRYDGAMKYLTSYEADTSGFEHPKSKLARYVEKQETWAKSVEMYALAQERQQSK